MTSPPAVIFDLDGTLADTIRDLVPALNRTIATRGLSPVSINQVGHVSGKGIKPMIKLAFELNSQPLETDLLDDLFEIYMEDYAQNLAVDTVLFPNARGSIEQFTENGWLLGVCTNKPVKLADQLLHELDIKPVFASITGGDSFEYRKPDPRHLIRTIELAGGKKSGAIMVGDSQNDILTAKNAGIPAIAVDFGYSQHPVGEYDPDIIISNFSDLFKAAQRLI